MTRNSLFVLSSILWLSTGCGSVEVRSADAGDGTVDAGDTADTTAPRIESFSPAPGAVGIPQDEDITIVFSEPMDQASVEAAWNSSELSPEDVTFLWNGDGTMLTATAIDSLPLAEGVGLDPQSINALTIGIRIEATATDLAGNTLEEAGVTDFATQKRLRVALERSTELTRTMRSDGLVFGASAVRLIVGDTSGNLQTKSFLSFTTPALPVGALVEAAVISVNQNGIENAPYALGDMEIFHVNEGVIDAAIFDTALAQIGVFSASDTLEVKSIDVAQAFRDDVENQVARGGRTQYRLEFPTGTDNDNADDEARISRSSIAMEVTYLVD